jgi:conjugal transfer pilus assembly protein TraK
MKKILRLSLCMLLAASSVQAEDIEPSVPPVPSISNEKRHPVLQGQKKQAADLKDQTSILPQQGSRETVIEPKPIKPTKDSTAVFDEPVPVNFIAPETPTIIQLSNRDINRIVCSGPMNDLIYSEEKGVTGHFSGNSAFVKFKAEEINGELSYADAPSELFVVCNGSVYTLIAEPQEIASVTLHLAAPAKDNFQKNIDHYKNMPLEKQVLQVIREAYEGGYPSSYKISKTATPAPVCSDLTVTQMQTIDVEGVGLRLKEYKAMNIKSEDAELQEKSFLDLGISDSILAVAVEDHVLQPHEATRVFVVEKREQQQ